MHDVQAQAGYIAIGAGALLVIVVLVIVIWRIGHRRANAVSVAPTAPPPLSESDPVQTASSPGVPADASNGHRNGNGNEDHRSGVEADRVRTAGDELGRRVLNGTAGWRHDPEGRPGYIRYFDGTAWTQFYARKIRVAELAGRH